MNSIQFKSKTQIQDAMLRFMNFIHGIVTQGLNCVRLVIGRLGKMGHGEFKAWTFLLSKGNLRKMSQKPKEVRILIMFCRGFFYLERGCPSIFEFFFHQFLMVLRTFRVAKLATTRMAFLECRKSSPPVQFPLKRSRISRYIQAH